MAHSTERVLQAPETLGLETRGSFRQEAVANFERMIVDQFDEMLLLSRKWPLVYSLVIHPFIIGHPFRLRALRRALAHIMKSRDQVWIATPGLVAAHFETVVPPPK